MAGERHGMCESAFIPTSGVCQADCFACGLTANQSFLFRPIRGRVTYDLTLVSKLSWIRFPGIFHVSSSYTDSV
jgi:hypothetical protein